MSVHALAPPVPTAPTALTLQPATSGASVVQRTSVSRANTSTPAMPVHAYADPVVWSPLVAKSIPVDVQTGTTDRTANTTIPVPADLARTTVGAPVSETMPSNVRARTSTLVTRVRIWTHVTRTRVCAAEVASTYRQPTSAASVPPEASGACARVWIRAPIDPVETAVRALRMPWPVSDPEPVLDQEQALDLGRESDLDPQLEPVLDRQLGLEREPVSFLEHATDVNARPGFTGSTARTSICATFARVFTGEHACLWEADGTLASATSNSRAITASWRRLVTCMANGATTTESADGSRPERRTVSARMDTSASGVRTTIPVQLEACASTEEPAR